MRLNFKRGEFLTSKLTAVLLLSAISFAQPSFAEISPDFSFIETSSKAVKLVNPLYLDTSRAEKPVLKINTSVPYSGEFEESDYFSSSIDDKEPENPPQQNAPPPSLPVVETNQNAPPQPTNKEENNNFFAPPQEETAKGEIVVPNQSEDSYYAAASESSDINLEGALIHSITISGLQVLNPQAVLSRIKTQSGSLFNTEVLQEDLQRIYAIGFFTDRMAVEPEIRNDGSVDLVFTLEENILVSDISIVGNTVISSVELMPFVMPMKGLPQNINAINESIDKINNYYHQKGYILAKVDSVDDDPDGALSLNINEGVIDKILIQGNNKTKDYVIERNILTQPGTVYNENYLKDDLSRIYATQIFSDVERKIEPSDTVDGEYNVTVVVKEQSTNSLAVGGGIDNALGAFGSISIREDNFLGKAQKLSVSGILGSGILLSDASIKNRMNYQLELNFFEPHFLNADNSLMSKLYYRDLGSFQVPLAIERRFGLVGAIEHKVQSYDGLTTNLSAGIEHISLSEGDFAQISSLYAKHNLNIANRAKELTGGFFVNLAPGVKYSSLDSKENPREGIVAQAKFMEALSLSDIKNTNGRLAGAITKYFPVAKKSSFSLTARGGIKVHGDEMPEVMAFRLGGPYSVRGFKMNGVGTGDAFLMGSAELATPLPFADRIKYDFIQKMRITFFVDAGKVFDPTISSKLYDRPLSAITAGVGLKVYIPNVGPISVDYGIPFTNPGAFGSKRGYFTFGTGGSIGGYGY